jgi:sialidase-1
VGIVYRNERSYCGPINMVRLLANGDLVVVFREALWRGYVTHADPTSRTSMVRSTDGGETWHSQVTPHTYAGNGCVIGQISNGSLIVNNFRWIFAPIEEAPERFRGYVTYREDERQGLAMVNEGVYTAMSRDDGYTWEPARLLLERVGSAGRVIELDDGSVLMPMDGKLKEHARAEWVMRSTDGGETWERDGIITAGVPELSFSELRILSLGNDGVLAGMRTQEANFYVSHSDDGGRTWNPPEETPIYCRGSSPFDLLLLDDGRVLATYGHRREPFGVRACLSEDGGRTWDVGNEVVLRDDGLDRDMGYPSSVQLPGGSIFTTYYWHHEDQIRHIRSLKWSVD